MNNSNPARLTVLIDPALKRAFEQLCAEQDMTVSQVLRMLIRTTVEGENEPVQREKRSRRR